MILYRVIIEDTARRRTRIIYRNSVSDIHTPIAPLLSTLPKGPSSILPERKKDLQELVDARIHIRIDVGRTDFHVAADVPGKVVIFSLAALEMIWAYTYFYLAIMELLKKYPKGTEINLTNLPDIAKARELGIWAHRRSKDSNQTPWPAHLPRPGQRDDPTVVDCDNYFYRIYCFMFLHEAAHITLSKRPECFA